MTRNKNSTNMLKDLISKKESQVNIAIKYGYSESYISQIAKQIRLLKYKPKLRNGELICFKCENKSDQFDIHHNNLQPIAIICHGCNIKLKDNELTYEIERRKQMILKYINNNKDKEITSTNLYHLFKDDFGIYESETIKNYLRELQQEKVIKKVRKGHSFFYVPVETFEREDNNQNIELVDKLVLLMIKAGINSDEFGISIQESEIESIINRLQESEQIG